MKKLLLLIITLITLSNVSYASFPVIHRNIVTTQTVGPELDHILNSILGGVAFFGTVYLLVRIIWRAYRRDSPWVKKLLRWKNIWWLLLATLIFLIIGILSTGSGMGG
tara:strand:+ start:71 stop:394 length:324 start_codon:yes stop_codon:yes gene_type:complete